MDADDGCAYKHDGYPKTPILTVLSRCAWYHPHLLETAMHPILLPIIEDVVGGDVRLEEHQYLINYPNKAGNGNSGKVSYVKDEGWHRRHRSEVSAVLRRTGTITVCSAKLSST